MDPSSLQTLRAIGRSTDATVRWPITVRLIRMASMAGVALALCGAANAFAAATPPPDVAASAEVTADRAELDALARTTLADLYRVQPQSRAGIESAAGYAVFSNFGMKLGVAGTGKGRGVAIDNPSGEVTYMRVRELQAGFGLGIKKYRLVWVFETQAAFDRFVSEGRQLGGQAAFSARSARTGGSFTGAAAVEEGVWVYQLTDKGIAAEVTVKASKYYKDRDLN